MKGNQIMQDVFSNPVCPVPNTNRSQKFIRGLITEKIGQQAYFFDEVTSTQDVARKLITNGVHEGTLVVSDRQIQGRGRLARKWHSRENKGIWATLIIRPDLPARRLPQFTLLTAVAISQALEETTGIIPEIKWPNDILVRGKKLCGILTEMVPGTNGLPALMIGFGINVGHRADDFPSDIKGRATSLFLETGKEWDHDEILQVICNRFEKLYAILIKEGFSPIKTLWESYCISLGHVITARTVSGTITGEALGIDHEGVLLLKNADGRIERLYSADIVT